MEQKTILTMLIFGFIVIICTLFIFEKTSTYKSKKEIASTIEQSKTQLHVLHEQHEQIIKAYKQREIDLKTTYVKHSLDLVKATDKTALLEKQIHILLSKKIPESDTIARLVNCDTLKHKTALLIKEYAEKDSIVQLALTNAATTIALQDTTIQLLTNNYEDLEIMAQGFLMEQKKLAFQLEKTQRKLKHRTFANRVLAGGFMILSGTITAYLIKK